MKTEELLNKPVVVLQQDDPEFWGQHYTDTTVALIDSANNLQGQIKNLQKQTGGDAEELQNKIVETREQISDLQVQFTNGKQTIVNEMQEALAVETQNRIQADEVIAGEIAKEAENRENAINGVKSQIAQETNERQSAIEEVNSQIAEEARNRQNAIDGLSSQIEQEAGERQNATGEINSRIEEEAENRQNAINGVRSQIEQETQIRQSAINDVNSQIEQEAANRQNAVENLNLQIEQEAEKRQNEIDGINERAATAEENLSSMISQESAARTAADNNLRNRINDNQTGISFLQSQIGEETETRIQSDAEILGQVAERWRESDGRAWVNELLNSVESGFFRFRGIYSDKAPTDAPKDKSYSDGTLWVVGDLSSRLPDLTAGDLWQCFVIEEGVWSETADITYGISDETNDIFPDIEERIGDLWYSRNVLTPYYRLDFAWREFAAGLDLSHVWQAIGEAATTADLSLHKQNTSNPHGVTRAQIGLGNVDNTSDADKPISAAQQTAINGRAAVNHTHTRANVTDFAHTHTTGEVTNLRTELEGKANDTQTVTGIDGNMDILGSSQIRTINNWMLVLANRANGVINWITGFRRNTNAISTGSIGSNGLITMPNGSFSNQTAQDSIGFDGDDTQRSLTHWLAICLGRIKMLTTGKSNVGHTHTRANITDFPASMAPTGNAGGDLGATYPNPIVNRIRQIDSRNTNPAPNDASLQPAGLRQDFKNNSVNGLNDGGTFNRVLTLTGWADSSGGNSHQLGFTDNGNMWIRTANVGATAWGTWQRLARTNEIPAQSTALPQALGGVANAGTQGTYATNNHVHPLYPNNNNAGDCNTIRTPGFYSGSFTNSPLTGWGSLLVLRSDTGDNFRQQIFVLESANRMWIRTSNGNTWRAWSEMNMNAHSDRIIYCGTIMGLNSTVEASWQHVVGLRVGVQYRIAFSYSRVGEPVLSPSIFTITVGAAGSTQTLISNRLEITQSNFGQGYIAQILRVIVQNQHPNTPMTVFRAMITVWEM